MVKIFKEKGERFKLAVSVKYHTVWYIITFFRDIQFKNESLVKLFFATGAGAV